MRNYHAHQIDTNGRTSGKVKTFCPQCRESRRNKRDKSLSIDLDQGLCHCHHCGWSLRVPDSSEERERAERAERARNSNSNNSSTARNNSNSSVNSFSSNSSTNSPWSTAPAHFKRPHFDPSKTILSERTERWLVETRCIPQTVIQSLQLTEQDELMPQSGQRERCLCFNYFENQELVNVKFRSGSKHFKMVTGAELIPYHIDAVHHTPEAIITEGELDAASFMAIGRDDVISVPAGANANLTWLDRFVETHFENKQVIYLAVDTDAAGLLLRAELLRRLGPERCRIVTYGPECKDANEHLVKYGVESLRIALEQAVEIPLEGIFTTSDLADDLRALYENGFGQGAGTGWEAFDKLCTFELQRLVVVTGVPGSGKSEWVDELVLRLCLRHDWRVGFFSPENVPIVYHLRKLAEKLLSRRFRAGAGMTEMLYQHACEFLDSRVCHILPKNKFTVNTILEKARQLVARRGIRIFVIDPLNRLEHTLPPGQTETQYLSTLLNRLSSFAVRNRCLVVLVAHPRKMNRNTATGLTPRPEMYDINGSADFYNKADFGFVVERDDAVGIVRLHIDKVKFKFLGRTGCATFVYDVVSGRYLPCEEDTSPQTLPADRVRGTQFDSKPWLPMQSEEGVQRELYYDQTDETH